MTKLLDSVWPEVDSHPTEERLLQLVDGEMADPEATQVRSHLEACWSCRVRTEKLQAGIAFFIDYRTTVLVPQLESPPRAWRTFEPHLRRVVEEAGRRSCRAVVRESLNPLWRAPRLVVSLIAVLTVLGTWLISLPRLEHLSALSANELLQQAISAQTEHVRTVSQPVIYQKLRVRRQPTAPAHDNSIVWELWRDATRPRVRQALTDARGRRFVTTELLPADGPPAEDLALLLELRQVFQANHLDWRQPLSPALFQAWRQTMSRKEERLVKGTSGNGLAVWHLEIIRREPVGLNGIMAATLVVRERDWHPVEQRLRVNRADGECGYALTESAFAVVNRPVLGPALFTETVVDAQPARLRPGRLALLPAAPGCEPAAGAERNSLRGPSLPKPALRFDGPAG